MAALHRAGQAGAKAYSESFNGEFKDECLNECRFGTIAEAQAIVETWRRDYNTVRPPGSLGNRTPREAAAEEATMAAGRS